jgi:ectoine hydroxylase-related dioxygenase (phytanoyl-CoA dioxygenase family)
MQPHDKKFFDNYGYLIINLHDDDLINEVNKDVENIISNQNIKTNSKIYSYNDSPRIVESYKKSCNCKALAKHPVVKDALSYLFDSNPVPFSTINFLRSTQQPLHSDYVHFGTLPELNLVGAWIALEDINPRSGPLQVVPGSHKMDIFEYIQLVDSLPKKLTDVKKQYTLYENWVRDEIKKRKLKPITPKLKKGQCILWAANLLHGSPDCQDSTLSRKSQVTHWTFDCVKMHYNPNFSIPSEKKYIKREVNYF